MSNAKHVSRERIMYFGASGFVELDHRQVELAPREYRVYFEEFEDGRVICTQLDRKSGDSWIRDKLWNELDEALTAALEADIAREQQEIVESYDAHAWRYGSPPRKASLWRRFWNWLVPPKKAELLRWKNPTAWKLAKVREKARSSL